MKKITAAKDTLLRVEENDEVYFVENEWEVNDNAEWNEADYTLPTGKYVRMKRLVPGRAGDHVRGQHPVCGAGRGRHRAARIWRHRGQEEQLMKESERQ